MLTLGIILTVTGVIALVLEVAGLSHLGPRATYVIAIALIVVGLPLLIAGLR